LQFCTPKNIPDKKSVIQSFREKNGILVIIIKKQIMPAKIRLQRHGKKGQPFYHIVVADGRAPRDGKFIEKIGTYNPLTKPAEINLDFDKALTWLRNGAQPTDTVRSLLSFKGVMYKNHLLKGVAKKALTELEAEAKFNKWLEEKTAKIQQAGKENDLQKREELKKALAVEKEINEKRAAEISKRRQAEMAKLESAAKAAAAEAKAAIDGLEETEEEEIVVETEEIQAEVTENKEKTTENQPVEETPAEETSTKETPAE